MSGADPSAAGASDNYTVPWPDETEFNFTARNMPTESSEKAIEGIVMAAIVIGVILTMFLLFSLAIFLDCRTQKLEAVNGKVKKSWRPSRKKSRIPVFIANSDANKDAIAFANQMCAENSATCAPASARGSDGNC